MAGLREQKKARTRAHIAATAAGLFGRRGYEHVTVADVAAAAEVSEQTVYNYFPAKEDLVLDQDDAIRERFAELVRARAADTTPAAAVRAEATALVDAIGELPADQLHGSLGHLATLSPAVRRQCLEATDRMGDALATAIFATTPGLTSAQAKLHGIALAWIPQTLVDEAGRRSVDGQPPEQIAREVRPLVESVVDEVDRWQRTALG